MYIRLIKNGAEGILEPFYDGGDSYRENEKYQSFFANYKTTPECPISQSWTAIDYVIPPLLTVTSERECDIDTDRFDEISLEAKITENITFKLIINGEEIISEQGKGDVYRYYGKLKDRHIKSVCMKFINTGELTERISVFFIGVRDSKFMLDEEFSPECTYPDWEGCFAENPVIEPCTEALIDKKDADKLREKMKSPAFAASYQATKKSAEAMMQHIPERQIGRFVRNLDGVQPYIAAATLSFVGFVEKDLEMLKMSARWALSLASIEYWCGFRGSDMEQVSGVVWHVRSFTECYCAFGIAFALEFAGSVMSWHGRNILYDSLIMKGLPRMDADFKTMEYIYHMNQGLVFSTGYAYALITLAKQYPRYKHRIEEIERDTAEMLRGSINPDGGMFEGPAYWDYTIQMFLDTACIFARYNNQTIKEYVGNKIDKTADFGLMMVNDDGNMRTVGDSKRFTYSLMTTQFVAQITENAKWIELLKQKRAENELVGGLFLTYYLYANEEITADESKHGKDVFISMPDTGYTYLRRGDDEFFGISGMSFSHCHPDKGSFMLDLESKPVLIDRGMCGYYEGVADKLSESRSHNMAVPVSDGVVMCQNAQHGYSTVLRKSEYKDGVLTWISDNDNVWDKSIVTKNVRTITSDKPYEYTIIDEFEFTKPCKVLVNFNMYDNKNVKIETPDWTPEKSEYVEYYCDFAKTPVMQQRFWSKEGTSFKLITKVTLKKEEE